MSGKPNPAQIAEVIVALDTHAAADAEVIRTLANIESDQLRVIKMREHRDAAWADYLRLMRAMDVSAEGNIGFEHRAAWFLTEMRRQLKEGGSL